MNKAINWIDDYYFSEHRKVFTYNELKIPALRIFGTDKIKNAKYPLVSHYHENCFEFTFIVNGYIPFFCDSTDYKAKGGDIFISRPNEIHSTNNIPITMNEIYWFQLDISNPNEFLNLDFNSAKSLIEKLNQIDTHLISTDNKEIKQVLIKAFNNAIFEPNPILISSYIVIFLNLLIEFSNKKTYIIQEDIKKSLIFIDNNIYDDIKLEDVAKNCGLSLSQFKQKFKNHLGISPRNYINQKKMSIAKKLLLQNNSITQVALDLGFDNISYFSTIFKKYNSISPSKFIQQNKNLRS